MLATIQRGFQKSQVFLDHAVVPHYILEATQQAEALGGLQISR